MQEHNSTLAKTIFIRYSPFHAQYITYYCWSADIVARAALILGKTDEADAYLKPATAIRQAFHKHFFDPETGTYAGGSQTANLLPLYLNIVPDNLRSAVLSELTSEIIYTHDTHLTTGIVGTKYLFPLRTRSGRSDLAYELATQTTYPSWGYMLSKGPTTLWELWQYKSGASTNSHNHPGSMGSWLYSALAGINPDPAAPGYRRIRFEPQVVRDLQWASGSLDTVWGLVASSWTRNGDTLRLEVSIPVGSEAEIHVPKLGRSSVVVSESGKPVWAKDAFQAGVPGVTGAMQTERTVIFEAGSGRYVFEVQ